MASLLLVFALAVSVPTPAISGPTLAPTSAVSASTYSASIVSAAAYSTLIYFAPAYSGPLLYTYTTAWVADAGTLDEVMPRRSGGEENLPGQGDYTGHILGMILPHWVIILMVLGAVAVLAVAVVLAISMASIPSR